MSQNGYNDFFKKKRTTAKESPASGNKNTTQNKKDWADEIERSFTKSRVSIRRKKAPKVAPMGALFFGLVLSAIGLAGYYAPEHVEDLLSSIDISIGVSALAKDGENKSPTTAEGEAKNADKGVVGAVPVCEEKKVYTEEELSHFSKLSERKNELDLREAELSALEEELHKQRNEIETRVEKLEAIRDEVANVLKERVEVDQQRVDKLVEFYSNMKPKQAADIFGKLNEDLAVEVLGKMKKKNAADIMNLLEPLKARALSEKFAGYKRR